MNGIMQQLPSAIGAEIITNRGGLFLPYGVARVKFRNWPIFINMAVVSTGQGGSMYTAIGAFFVARDQLRLA